MEITTKFNVHDLVRRKYDTDDDETKQAFEILEGIVQVCYTTVQITYLCRPVFAMRKTEGYGENKKVYWKIAHGISREDGNMGWSKYREDELIPCSQETFDIITGVKK
jgi:hypothetical protein